MDLSSDRQQEIDTCLAICRLPVFSKLANDEAQHIRQRLEALPQPLEMLETHALGPLVWFRLGKYLKGDLARGLKLLAWRHQHSNEVRLTLLVTVLDRLAQASCRPVLLKGSALLARGIYPVSAWRPMRDIDILIQPATWREAKSTLNAMGFIFDRPTRIARYPYLHHLPTAKYTTSTGVTLSLELHYRLTAFDGIPLEKTNSLLQQTETVQINGRSCQVLDLGTFLMHLWRHQMGHSYQPRFISYLDSLLVALRVPKSQWSRYEDNWPEMVNYVRMLFRIFRVKGLPLSGIGVSVSGFGKGLPTFREAWYGSWTLKKALLHPGNWWLHAFYGIPEEHDIGLLLWLRHLLNLIRRCANKVMAWLGSFLKSSGLKER